MLPTGIDRTCLAYVAHYRRRAQAVLQWGSVTRVLSPEQSYELFDILLDQGQEDVSAKLRPLALRSLGGLLFGRTIRGQVERRVYLNVGHTGLDMPGHARWLARANVRPIYFLHDLIPLTHPEYCRGGEQQKHLRRMVALAGHAEGVITNSHDTLAELTKFARQQRVLNMPPGMVAPLGADAAGTVPKLVPSALSDKAYFVMLGTIEGRKNHLLMLTLWAELARRLGSACPQLVIIGRRGWECEQVVDMLERSEAIRGHVVELSQCGDAVLSAYLRGARALLFPSFVEGYGLPLVEALACGTPVIASDLPVFRELAGCVPDYLSPIDGLGWTQAIENYAQRNSVRRSAQLARMSGWSPPTWEAHFDKVDRFLDQIAATPPRSALAPSD